MITLALLCGAIGALVLSALSSGAEMGLYSLNRVRLRVAQEHGDPGARRLAALNQRLEDAIIVTLVGTNIADYLLTACVTALLLHAALSDNLAELYATAIATPLVLVFGGILPKNWFRREGDQAMYALALPLQAAVRLLRGIGLIAALRTFTRTLLHLIQPQATDNQAELLPRARTLRLLEEGAVRGGLSPLQRDLIERVVTISQTRVGSVMIPRARAALLAIDTPRDNVLRAIRMAHFSRMPVYAGQPRRVVGILNVYDVLTDPAARPIREHIQPAFRLGPELSVAQALVRMQRARQAMAIVENRQGDCIGILTIKDLVQQIVGYLEAW